MKESPIFTRTYDLLRWLIPLTVKFPRTHRFVLAARVQETALRFQERLIEAGRTSQPVRILAEADTDLAKLRLYMRLCRDLQLIAFNQYEHGQRLVDEVGRLMGGWRNKVESSM
jgi:cytosine/adenosine deaminase-related metal-dependent hydrolase